MSCVVWVTSNCDHFIALWAWCGFISFFVYIFVYMPCVQLMPSNNYYSYTLLQSYIDPHIKCGTVKTFFKLQLIFGGIRVFKYAVRVVKQLCEKSK
jgi:hypothetical protein